MRPKCSAPDARHGLRFALLLRRPQWMMSLLLRRWRFHLPTRALSREQGRDAHELSTSWRLRTLPSRRRRRGGGYPFSLEIGVPDRQFITHSRLLEQMALKGRELVYQRAGIDQLRNRHHGGQRGCERYHPIESRADLSHTEDSRPSDPRHYAETLSSASPELNPHDGSHAESQSHPVDAHPPTTLPLPLSP